MHHLKPLGEFKLSYCPETLNSGQNRRFIVWCDLEIWRMTLKNNRAPLLCCFKLCASFHSHRWIQTKVTVRKRSIRVQIGDLLSRVTLKFDGWPWKTIGHLFYVASSFVHHFLPIGEFKLELQSGNAQSGSNSDGDNSDMNSWLNQLCISLMIKISDVITTVKTFHIVFGTKMNELRNFNRTNGF